MTDFFKPRLRCIYMYLVYVCMYVYILKSVHDLLQVCRRIYIACTGYAERERESKSYAEREREREHKYLQQRQTRNVKAARVACGHIQ